MRVFALVLTMLMSALLPATMAPTATAEVALSASVDDRPNILLITSDDQRADEMQFMPKTVALLGDQGITFDNAITPHPLCCPARAELLSGQYAHNNGVRTNSGPQGGFSAYDARYSIATDLQAAGYETAMLGKHLNSVDEQTISTHPGWSLFNPTLNGYSDYYDFRQYNNGNPINVSGYYTDYLRTEGVKMLGELSSMDAPFFAWFSHFAPHHTRYAGDSGKYPPLLSPKYQQEGNPNQAAAKQYAADLMADPSFNEDDVSDKQALIQGLTKVSRNKIEDMAVGRAGALASLDDAVAAYVQKLADDGELDNTYIMFITDNGFLLGEHREIGKVLPFEENFRMPLLVRGPGVAPGTSSPHVATTVDMAATFLDIAGATPTGNRVLDGASFKNTLNGGLWTNPHKSGVLTQGGPVNSQTGDRGWYYRGIRTDQYTYTEYFDGHVELFDRNADPHEIQSRAGWARYQDLRNELSRRLGILKTCTGDVCNTKFGDLPSTN